MAHNIMAAALMGLMSLQRKNEGVRMMGRNPFEQTPHLLVGAFDRHKKGSRRCPAREPEGRVATQLAMKVVAICGVKPG
jgi:hypothetical protein